MALSNKYLEVIIKSLESKIFNEKVLFYKIKKSNKTSTFSVNIFDSIDCMMTSNVYLIEQSQDYKLVTLSSS